MTKPIPIEITHASDSRISDEASLLARLKSAANDEGTIQARDMLRIAPHHRQDLHTTMSMGAAFLALTGREMTEEEATRE